MSFRIRRFSPPQNTSSLPDSDNAHMLHSPPDHGWVKAANMLARSWLHQTSLRPAFEPLPCIIDLRIGQIRPIADFLVIVDVVDDGTDYRYIAVARKIIKDVNRDFTGECISEGIRRNVATHGTSGHHGRMRMFFDRLRQVPEPTDAFEFFRRPTGDYYRACFRACPYSLEGSHVDMIICATTIGIYQFN